MQITDSFEETLMLGKIESRKRKGWQRVVGLYHWLVGHESEQPLGVGDGQGSLAWCSPWGHKELHMLEWLNRTELHSSVLAWRIPVTGEPGTLPSMGSHRVGHAWSDLAAAAAWSNKISRTLLGFRHYIKLLTPHPFSSPRTVFENMLLAVLTTGHPLAQMTWVTKHW